MFIIKRGSFYTTLVICHQTSNQSNILLNIGVKVCWLLFKCKRQRILVSFSSFHLLFGIQISNSVKDSSCQQNTRERVGKHMIMQRPLARSLQVFPPLPFVLFISKTIISKPVSYTNDTVVTSRNAYITYIGFTYTMYLCIVYNINGYNLHLAAQYDMRDKTKIGTAKEIIIKNNQLIIIIKY